MVSHLIKAEPLKSNVTICKSVHPFYFFLIQLIRDAAELEPPAALEH